MGLKADLNDLKKSTTSIFRDLLRILIPDRWEWANRNAKLIEKDFLEVTAARGKFRLELLNLHDYSNSMKVFFSEFI